MGKNNNTGVKNQVITILMSLLMVAEVLVGMLFCVLMENDGSKQGYFPKAESGEISLTDYSFNLNQSRMSLAGDVEFYYGKWIETDNEQGASKDCYIHLPRTWTGLTVDIDGKPTVLTNNGYASYKVTLTGLTPNTQIGGLFNPSGIPYRYFINGVEVTSYGEMSKENYHVHFYQIKKKQKTVAVPSSGTIEVVLEVPNCGTGGIKSLPGIYSGNLDPSNSNLWYGLNSIIVGILMASFGVISVVFFVSTAKDSIKYLFASTCSALIYLLLSIDGVHSFLKWTYFVLPVMALPGAIFLVLAIVLLICHISHNHLLKIPKWVYYSYYTICLLSCISMWFLRTSLWTCIPYMVIIGLSFPFVVALMKKLSKGNYYYYIVLGSVISMMIGLLGVETMSEMSILSYEIEHIPSVLLFAAGILVFLIYLLVPIKLKKEEDRLIKNRKEWNELSSKLIQKRSLQEDLSSSIDSVKKAYKENIDRGDKVLGLFADNLRVEINSLEHHLIGFDKEVNNALSYIDLLNAKSGKDYQIILDIDSSSYQVPNAFLPTLINQAVKLKNEDALIFLSSDIDLVQKALHISLSFESDKEPNDNIGDLAKKINLSCNGTVKVGKENGVIEYKIDLPLIEPDS